jgi:histidinol-phosphate/aromatic aminotransferase/cobyric acid decarboxylase-like protein
MPLQFHLNPTLATLPTYQPGRPIEEVAREIGLPASDIIKLASNENPLGPSPKALAAIQAAAASVHLYPDGNAFYFKRRLADKLNVETSNLILGNGSNEIIEFIGHALMAPGADVVVSQYCFAIYPIITKMAARTSSPSPRANSATTCPPCSAPSRRKRAWSSWRTRTTPPAPSPRALTWWSWSTTSRRMSCS